MMKKKGFLIIGLLLVFLLSGCQDSAGDSGTQKEHSAEEEQSQTEKEMFTERDSRATYDESTAVTIMLNGDSATATSDSVRISGSTITITEEATYLISGTLNNGMIAVDTSDTAKPQLVFRNVDITNETSAPLYILKADKVVVTLEGENSLANGGSFEAIDDNHIDAAVFSKEDLTFNGSGSLTVSSPAGHGIVGKDDLVFTGGTYTIVSADHAIDANDSVRVTNTVITAAAGKDGIHAENNDDTTKGFVYIADGTFEIEAEGDGISAGAYMQIEDGNFQILAGGGYENGTKESSDGWGGFGGGRFGGSGMPGGRKQGRGESTEGSTMSYEETEDSSTSMKGLKAEGAMVITNGKFTIDCADDAVHSDTSITVNSGEFEIASGDDAFHAEDTLTINGGNIHITNSYEALEALHIIVNDGDIRTVSSDDGLNAAGGNDSSGTAGGRDGRFGGGGFGHMSGNSDGSITINGGTLYINASGDGIDANGTLEITGGHTTIVGPTQGDTATLDYDISAVISGGTLIGSGSSMMAQSITGSGQGVIAVSVGQQTENTNITVSDADGNEILFYTPELSFQIFIFSSPEIVSGDSYNLTVGSVSGEIQAN